MADTQTTQFDVRGFKGELIHPGDGEYDEARKVFNGMIDRSPALVARCADAADVGRDRQRHVLQRVRAVCAGRQADADIVESEKRGHRLLSLGFSASFRPWPTSDTASTSAPAWAAAMVSITVDMPTSSAPSVAAMRTSAGVS